MGYSPHRCHETGQISGRYVRDHVRCSDDISYICRIRSIGQRTEGRGVRQIHTRYADTLVGHSIIHIESIGFADIVAAVDPGRKYHVGNDSVTFLVQHG